MSLESELTNVMEKLQETKQAAVGNKYRIAAIIIGLAALLAIVFFVWQYTHQPQPVTGESQQQAETQAGLELAAKNAQIEMLQSQLDEAAKQITELKNKPPNTVIKTVPVEVMKTVEVERQKSGADFAIVTDPKQPDKTVDLKDVEKLPADTSVTLNQYNVFAYKKVIRGVNVYPDWSETARGKFKIDEVTADISRRITRDGKYLGVSVGYDFEHDKAKAGIRYSF